MITKYSHYIIIISFFLVYACFLVLKLDFYGFFTPDWDESHHLLMSYNFYRAILESNWEWFFNLLLKWDQIYPPIYHILTSYGIRIFGVSANAGVYTNIVFILVSMLSLYEIGRQIGNKNAGLIAAVLTPLLPVFLSLQERTTIDYSSVAFFLVSVYLLYKTEGFTNTKFSILFGFSILVNLLTKWPFVVPMIPFLFYIIFSIKDKKESRLTILFNLTMAGLIALAALPWYVFNTPSIIKSLTFFWNDSGYPQLIWANPERLSLANILLYAYTSPIEAVGIIPTICFYASLIFSKKTMWNKYLFASIIFTYGVLTYLNDKSGYYFAYSYPFLMIIACDWLLKIRKKTLMYPAIAIFILAIVGNFAVSVFNYQNFRRPVINFAGMKIVLLPNYPTKFTSLRWPTASIVKSHVTEASCPNGILVFPDNAKLNASNIRYYLLINKRNINTASATGYYNPAKETVFNTNIIDQFDCVITKTGDVGLFSNRQVNDQVNSYLSPKPKYISRTFSAPDNSEVILFIKKHEQN